MPQSHHITEAGILLREFKDAGFDCVELTKVPAFVTAMSQYGCCKMTKDELFDIVEKLAILNPGLKKQLK